LTVLLLFLVILFVHAVLLEESFPPHGTFTIGYLFSFCCKRPLTVQRLYKCEVQFLTNQLQLQVVKAVNGMIMHQRFHLSFCVVQCKFYRS
jgi:hypothetical protein